MRGRRARGRALLFVVPVVVMLAMQFGVASAALPEPEQVFFVPLPEAAVDAALTSVGASTTGTMHSVISITAVADGTIVYYDEWEDGFETALEASVQSTTKVWGDNDPSNGIPPGFATDILDAGSIVILESDVPLPRSPATILYDAGDRFGSTSPVAATRAVWDLGIGTVAAGAVEVPNIGTYGLSYEVPAGADLLYPSATDEMFEYTSLVITASVDGTTVDIDTDADGLDDVTVLLDRGETHHVDGGVLTGATVTGTEPIMSQLITGDIGATYESRFFALVPTSTWSSTYYTPVGSASSNETVVVLYNPHTSPLTVNATTLSGTVSISVPAGNAATYLMPVNSGGRFSSSDGRPFQALSGIDTEDGNSTAHDWGFTLLPSSSLTSSVLAGWGPGSRDLTGNGSPIWVTSDGATRLYVDFDGDPTTGSLTDPNGNRYDQHTDMTVFQSLRLFDTINGDNDQTGTRAYTIDGTLIAAAWGQDPDTASPGNPYLDLGTTILPIPVYSVFKSAEIADDLNNNGYAENGDTIRYTIRVSNDGPTPENVVIVQDDLPPATGYVLNTTTVDATPVADDAVGTPYLFDEGGFDVGAIPPFTARIITFDALISSLAPGQVEVTNEVTVVGSVNVIDTAVLPVGGTPCAALITNDSFAPIVVLEENDAVYLEVSDLDESGSVSVLLTNTDNGDLETITLVETGSGSGIFRSSIPSSTLTGGAAEDGTLLAFAGDTVRLEYADADSPDDTCSQDVPVIPEAAGKTLYLSDPAQGMDRIDPVATADGTTATSATLDAIVDTYNVRDSFNTNRSFAGSDGSEPWLNAWQELGESDGPDKDVVEVESRSGCPTTNTICLEIADDNEDLTGYGVSRGADLSGAGTATLSFEYATNSDPTGSVLLQIRPAGDPGWTTLDTYDFAPARNGTESFDITPYISSNTEIRFIAEGATTDFGGFYADEVDITWQTITPSSTTFAQTDAMTLDFVVLGGRTVQLTTIVDISSGTVTPPLDITATLGDGATTFATLTSPSVVPLGGTLYELTWIGLVPVDFMVATGERVSVDLTTSEPGLAFQILYDSATHPSQLILPTTTYISIESIGAYDAPSPGGSPVTNPAVGQTVHLRTTVSDPFGSADITGLDLTIQDGCGGAPTNVSLTNSDVVDTTAATKTYEVEYTVPPGCFEDFTITAVAHEGTEGITDTDQSVLEIDARPELRVAKSGPATAAVGENITFTFAVTNDDSSGDGSPISAVAVSDDVTGTASYVSGDDGDGLLEVGETWIHQASHTVLLADPDPLDNIATVSGTDLDGDPVDPATDTHSTNLESAPEIEIAKSGPSTAAVNNTITYTFTVSHGPGSDDSPILGVSVSDNVAGVATYVSGDDGDGLLESGESWTYTVDYTIVQTDPDPLVNVATAAGVDADGDPVSDTDSHSAAIVFAPILDIVKSGPATAAVGDMVTYGFSVAHDAASDDSPLSSVWVVDDVAGTATYVSGDDGDGLLEGGETWLYAATHNVVGVDPDPLDNTVIVSGVDRESDVIQATDSHSTDISYAPVISINKSGPVSADVGDTVNYGFAVRHGAGSDGSPISALTVTDDVAGPASYVSGDDGDALLEQGEIWIFQALYTVQPDDPALLTNTGTVTGNDPEGDVISDNDTHDLAVSYAPLLQITKSGPATAEVGDVATYTFDVGHAPGSDRSVLSALLVVDDVAGAATYVSGDDGDNLLEFGETWSYSASHTVTGTDADPLVNTVTATATDLEGDTVTSTDDHTLPIEFDPRIEIIKTAIAVASPGRDITYTFSVRHTPASDGSPVSTVTVTDSLTSPPTYLSGDDGDGLLESGETWTYQANRVVLITDPDPLVNTATVSGADRDGDPVGDTDMHSTAIDFSPILNVTKSGPATADTGDAITYTMAVEHDPSSDGSAVSNMSVTDDVAGPATYLSGDTNLNDELDLGETWLWEAYYTVANTDPNVLTNTVTVDGTDPDGDPVTAQDSHATNVEFNPVLQLEKSGPAYADVGENATYYFSLSHAATSDGSDVILLTLDDTVGGSAVYISGDTDADGRLDDGETWNFQVSHVVSGTDPNNLLNIADALGTDRDGDQVGATDTHVTDVEFDPIIEVIKTGPGTAAIGDTVGFAFLVSHAPGSDGSPVTVDSVIDDVAGPAAYDSGDDGDGLLEASETWTYTAQYTIAPTDPDPLINTVAVAGTDSDGEPLSATDGHSTDLLFDPEIEIAKSGPANANVGDVVSYTFLVSHGPGSDGSPINGVSVSDDVAGPATYASGDDGDGLLEAGETWLHTASHTVTLGDPDPLDNTVVVTAQDSDGGVLTDSDDHSTDIVYAPLLDIDKEGPAAASVGDTITYTFLVSHGPGSDGSPIDGVSVSDDVAGPATYASGDDGDGLLEANETWLFSVDYIVLPDDPDPVVNTATAEGTDRQGATVDAIDSHSTDISFEPQIDVVKSGPGSLVVGQLASYTFAVSHGPGSDGSPINGVSVSDDVAGPATYASGDDGDGLFEAGETWQFSASYTVETSDDDPLINTATASGTDGDGDLHQATDGHSGDIEFEPIIEVVKSGPASAGIGQLVTYTFEVAHAVASDDSPVSTIALTDDVTGTATYVSGDDGDGLLEASETWVFTADHTITGTDPDPLVNSVTASGLDRDGDTVSDSDTHSLDIVVGALDVDKTPAFQTVIGGGTATFVIDVTNIGDVDLTNVVLSDPLAPDCDQTIGTLVAGASTSVSCDVTAVAADFTNTATVTGDDPLGGTVSDSDNADVDVIGPAVTIDKTPDTQPILAGDDATFAIEITNTGDVDLSNVVVADPSTPACDSTIGSLAPGATTTYTCDATAVTADFTNTATVTGDDPLGGTVSDSDNADVDVIAPAVTIDKTPDTQSILAGDDATFAIEITNTGDVDLSNVVVADPSTPACDSTIGSLAPGATTTYTCGATAVTADFTNTATVTADHPAGGTVTDEDSAAVDVGSPAVDLLKTPDVQSVVNGGDATFTIEIANTGDLPLTNLVVTDPVAPDCDRTIALLAIGSSSSFTCTFSEASADFTNTATVVADHQAGGTVSSSDSADVLVLVPSIELQKSPDSQLVVAGADATFTIVVTNTSAVDLDNVSVSDPVVPTCDAVVGSLAAGASTSYSCNASALTSDLVNIATVIGTDPIGGTVTDSDSATVDVFTAAMEVNKTPDAQTVVTTGDATFSIEVANTGDVELSSVVVSDPTVPDCDTAIGTLAVGTSATINCSLTGVTADFTNTVSVSAQDPLGNPVAGTDAAAVTVLVPAIEIQKTPDIQTVRYGATVPFTITVTNSGETDLTDVTVVDPLVPNCDTVITFLAVGTTTSYSCDVADVIADFTNMANVTGQDPIGNSVSDSDSAMIDVITPVIDIEKTPDLQTIRTGEDSTFTIDLTNTGDVVLSNIVVTDPLAPNCDITIPAMAPGSTQSYTCTLTAVTADFVNEASATAQDPLGRPLSDDDTAQVDVIAPGIEISKTPDVQTVLLGDDAVFTITVENTGDVDLTGVEVTDPLVPDCDATIGALAIGASATYTCNATTLTADLNNVALVQAIGPLLNTVSDSDDAVVDVIDPAIELSKTPDAQSVVTGGDATFTIEISNTGDVDLTDVTVSDPSAPGCDATVGLLPAGTSTTIVCTVTAVTSDFTNTATVTASDPLDNTLSDSDSGSVTVLTPAIDVQKTPDIQTVLGGDDATFTISVTNAGQTALTNVVMIDPAIPDCDNTAASLNIGETITYSCIIGGANADLVNVVDVTADDPLGNQVSDSDSAVLEVIAPEIAIAKTPDSQVVLTGTDATFTIEVSNTGDADLTNVAVSDPLVPACDAVIGSLLIGESNTFTCDAVAVGADFTNTATVTASDPLSNVVTDDDSADVSVLTAAIDVQKSPNLQTVLEGTTATFTIEVTNAGTAPLTNAAVTDPLVPSCDTTIGFLGVGDSATYSCSTTATTPFTNTASVSADDPVGRTVTDSDIGELLVTPVGDIGGQVFVDTNGDGVQQGGEPNLADVDVIVTLSDGSTVIVSTDPAGDWSLPGVPIGTTTADVDEADPDFPTGHTLTTGNDPQSVVVTTGALTEASPVGYAPEPSIGGLVWIDENGDGQQGGTETAVQGVQTNLWVDTNADGVPDTIVASAATGADGSYSFIGIPAGTYAVDFAVPAGFVATTIDVGDDSSDSDLMMSGRTAPVTVVAGRSLLSVDAGLVVVEALGDLDGVVWIDTDRDGSQDASEPLLSSVELIAVWAGSDGDLGTTDDVSFSVSTDTVGRYSIEGIPVGTYRVTVDATTIPAGLLASYDLDGTLDGSTATTVIDAERTSGIDFGYRGSGSLGDQVWVDADDDGAFDSGEEAVANVSIVIVWDGPDGVPNTSDDVAYSAITDSSGRYLLEDLPFGGYTISALPDSLPSGVSVGPPVRVELVGSEPNLSGDIALTRPNPPPSTPLALTGRETSNLALRGLAMLIMGMIALVAGEIGDAENKRERPSIRTPYPLIRLAQRVPVLCMCQSCRRGMISRMIPRRRSKRREVGRFDGTWW